LLNTFDIQMMNCVDLYHRRFQRGMPRSVPFRINSRWEVIVDNKKVLDLDSYDFD
jgi:hypothetical protein